MRHGRGFTIFELLLTVVIFSLICASALPSFASMVRQQTLTSTANDLQHALKLTRAEAGFRGTRVALIAPTGNWSDGWRIFKDNNKNGVFDPDEVLIHEHGQVSNRISIQTGKTVRGYIGFNANGNSVHPNNAFLADTIKLCSSQPNTDSLIIKISITGRSTIERIHSNLCGG